MAPTINGLVNFNEIPERSVNESTIAYGPTTIDLENAELNGGVLLKTLYLSIDPHLRIFIYATSTSTGSG
jgi:NADPH-dependent curcumin reductase CurA